MRSIDTIDAARDLIAQQDDSELLTRASAEVFGEAYDRLETLSISGDSTPERIRGAIRDAYGEASSGVYCFAARKAHLTLLYVGACGGLERGAHGLVASNACGLATRLTQQQSSIPSWLARELGDLAYPRKQGRGLLANRPSLLARLPVATGLDGDHLHRDHRPPMRPPCREEARRVGTGDDLLTRKGEGPELAAPFPPPVARGAG